MASGMRICPRCRALYKLPAGPEPPCRGCGFPDADTRDARQHAVNLPPRF